jgi:hypothetical protein
MERIKNQIKNTYTTALDCIKKGNYIHANKIITNMPVHLYDFSLDLIDNRNPDMKDLELRTLVKKVQDSLSSDELILEEEESYVISSDLKDIFPLNTF